MRYKKGQFFIGKTCLYNITTYTYTALDNANTITYAAESIYQYTYDKKDSELEQTVAIQTDKHAASFLLIATPVKQWIQEHVDFYVTCAIVKESIDNSEE